MDTLESCQSALKRQLCASILHTPSIEQYTPTAYTPTYPNGLQTGVCKALGNTFVINVHTHMMAKTLRMTIH